MKELNETSILQIMKSEYARRLTEAMNEVDVFDDRDNMILGKGLKVKHKETQLEYTIDDVYEDDTGKLMIRLNLPEEPRFDVPPSDEIISDTPPVRTQGHLGEDDLLSADEKHEDGLADPMKSPEGDDDVGAEYFVIDKEEFEKEYEVK